MQPVVAVTFATTPCRSCGAPVVPVTVSDGQGNDFVQYGDPNVNVLLWLRDGEGASFWTVDRTGETLARHACGARA